MCSFLVTLGSEIDIQFMEVSEPSSASKHTTTSPDPTENVTPDCQDSTFRSSISPRDKNTNRPDTLCSASVHPNLEQRTRDNEERLAKLNGTCTTATRNVPDNGVISCPSNVDKSVTRGSNQCGGSSCAARGFGATQVTRAVSTPRPCDTRSDQSSGKSDFKEENGDYQAHWDKSSLKVDLDPVNVQNPSRRKVSLAKQEREPVRRSDTGGYSLASPITDCSQCHVTHSNDINRVTSKDRDASPLCNIGLSNIPNLQDRRVLSPQVPVLYANVPNAVFYSANQVCPPNKVPTEHSGHHIYRDSHSNVRRQDLGSSCYSTNNKELLRQIPVIRQTQAECDSCSCLGYLKSKEQPMPGPSRTISKEEHADSKATRYRAEMESNPSGRQAAAPPERHYYNSGSAFLKPLMKRMSMFAKTGAFKGWGSSNGEKTSKPGKSKNESKTRDGKALESSSSAVGEENRNSAATDLDLSLPPRFSQIDSCPRYPFLSSPLPQQHQQGSHHYPLRHDHSRECQQQQLQHHHQNQRFDNHPERQHFVHRQQPQQERYVLHQSCSGFSLNYPSHSPSPAQQQHFHHPQVYNQYQLQSQYEQQQLQLLHQHQHPHQQHYQLARRLSTESVSSLLQTVRCGQHRYRVSPVSLLWTFLSVLLAGACVLSLITPCWMVHPDHIHSFGLFNLCVRDRRFAVPRSLCIPYSDMKQWGVALPSAFTSLSSSSQHYPSFDSSSSPYLYSTDYEYFSDIPKSRVVRGVRRRKPFEDFDTKDEFLSSHDLTNFGAKKDKNNVKNHDTSNTDKQSDLLENSNKIYYHRNFAHIDSKHSKNKRNNQENVGNHNNNNQNSINSNNSNTTSSRGDTIAHPMRAQTAAQRSSHSRRHGRNVDDDTSASGLLSIPSVAWQAACVLFGAGVCVQVLSAVISIVILVVPDPLHRRLASANGFLQAAGGGCTL